MGAEIYHRLLGADQSGGVPERRVTRRPACPEPRWSSWVRTIRHVDVEPCLGACWPARAGLALGLLAGVRHGGVEQRSGAGEHRRVELL